MSVGEYQGSREDGVGLLVYLSVSLLGELVSVYDCDFPIITTDQLPLPATTPNSMRFPLLKAGWGRPQSLHGQAGQHPSANSQSRLAAEEGEDLAGGEEDEGCPLTARKRGRPKTSTANAWKRAAAALQERGDNIQAGGKRRYVCKALQQARS
ncbi:hypothetical protein L198_07082 [Cryptococcus wingfieldii CBS 7118]|uniref:Uncharacterized protein n=1 Tax=Cryptococcus wingfieldii CBS 7118 TaxID=1295528 RepID=A0A1E3IER1_9TREE|nr:hypothetical protein L198_07082 [Cryptococcus wingfieldii CBS 7118]ODN87080.1 hypothetical protein L198_07082 [Cryptococcus wingfieldii CBS 7118]